MNNIDRFEDFLENSNKSDGTIKLYISDAKQFLEYIKSINKELNTINKNDIKNFINNLWRKERLNVKTINRKIVAIKHFLEFNDINIHIRQNKVQDQNFLDNVLTNEDIYKMIMIAEEKKDIRAKAIMYFLYYTGVRVSELIQVKLKDVGKNEITIIGKGQKYRKVFISNKLNDLLKEYANNRKSNDEFLFVGQRGRLTRSNVWRIIKKYGDLAGIDKDKVYCHSYRHKFALNLIDSDVDLTTVSKLLGHSNIQTTTIYLQRSKDELLKIVNKL